MDIKFKNDFAELKRLQKEKAFLSKIEFIEDDLNLSIEEVKTILERANEDCKAIILGDIDNDSENKLANSNGINEFL